MLRNSTTGKLIVYVAKKDLEEEVLEQNQVGEDWILTLSNGWELSVAGLENPIQTPQTVEARRLN